MGARGRDSVPGVPARPVSPPGWPAGCPLPAQPAVCGARAAPSARGRARCGAEGAECGRRVAKSPRAEGNPGPGARVLAPAGGAGTARRVSQMQGRTRGPPWPPAAALRRMPCLRQPRGSLTSEKPRLRPQSGAESLPTGEACFLPDHLGPRRLPLLLLVPAGTSPASPRRARLVGPVPREERPLAQPAVQAPLCLLDLSGTHATCISCGNSCPRGPPRDGRQPRRVTVSPLRPPGRRLRGAGHESPR